MRGCYLLQSQETLLATLSNWMHITISGYSVIQLYVQVMRGARMCDFRGIKQDQSFRAHHDWSLLVATVPPTFSF